MTDPVKVALIGLGGIGLSNFAAIIMVWMNLRKKVNGINAHLQGKLDKQSVALIEMANGKSEPK